MNSERREVTLKITRTEANTLLHALVEVRAQLEEYATDIKDWIRSDACAEDLGIMYEAETQIIKTFPDLAAWHIGDEPTVTTAFEPEPEDFNSHLDALSDYITGKSFPTLSHVQRLEVVGDLLKALMQLHQAV